MGCSTRVQLVPAQLPVLWQTKQGIDRRSPGKAGQAVKVLCSLLRGSCCAKSYMYLVGMNEAPQATRIPTTRANPTPAV